MTYLATTLVLFVLQTSNLSHIVPHRNAKKKICHKGQRLRSHKRSKIQFLSYFFLFVIKNCNLCHLVGYGKENTFLTCKFKGEDQGHIKGENNNIVSYCKLWKGQKIYIFKIKGQNNYDHNFVSICSADFHLVSYCS